jgi:hypothetical protein
MNENEDTPYQNLGNAANTVLQGKFIALSTYFKKNNFKSVATLRHWERRRKKTEASIRKKLVKYRKTTNPKS